MSRFTVEYFIEKFKAIPEANWTTRKYRSGDSACSLGHCGEGYAQGRYNSTEESEALKRLFYEIDTDAVTINDGASKCFTQSTPKKRILAALQKIKETHQCP